MLTEPINTESVAEQQSIELSMYRKKHPTTIFIKQKTELIISHIKVDNLNNRDLKYVDLASEKVHDRSKTAQTIQEKANLTLSQFFVED